MGFVKGHTKFGGRQKGRPNRATADIKALAHKHGPDAIAELARLAKHARSEMTRVAAIRELLDRGFGKASQPVEGEVQFGISLELQRILDTHDGLSRSVPDRSPTALVALNGAVTPPPLPTAPNEDGTGNGNAEVH